MRLSDPKHPYQQHRRQHRATLRNPSASQNAVRYWWTKTGTKLAHKMVDENEKDFKDFTKYLREMVEVFKDKMIHASADQTHVYAADWGKYSRMLELHNGV